MLLNIFITEIGGLSVIASLIMCRSMPGVRINLQSITLTTGVCTGARNRCC